MVERGEVSSEVSGGVGIGGLEAWKLADAVHTSREHHIIILAGLGASGCHAHQPRASYHPPGGLGS